MKKNLNPFYIVKENENIEQIAKTCQTSAISLLIKNQILPKDVKKGKVLFY